MQILEEQIKNLEYENRILREALKDIQKKMENNEVPKSKNCQYCKYFVQHYAKGGFPAHSKDYIEIFFGHCVRGVPIKKGGKRNTAPDDTCQYFEVGTHNMDMGMNLEKR